MTEWLNVSDITPRIAYTATALQTVFTVPFVFFSTSDLHVYQNTALLTLGTHYTVAGAENEAGGTVTLVTGCTVGDAILIVRDVPITQTTHIPPSGPLDISAINIQISKLIAIDQQLQNKTTRTLHFPDSDSTLSGELAAVTSRKNKLLGFDTNGAIIYPLGPTFVGETSTGVAHVDSRATAQVTTFAASVNIIVTAGYASPGDGGGWVYKRGNASSPGVFQDAGGVYWGLDIGTSAVSVRWFGAKGDGVTDDSIAVQAAITYLSGAGGGTVFFPRGGYLCNTTLTISGSHVRLLGEHVAATSIFSTNTNPVVIAATGTRHSIENLLIFANTFSDTSGAIVSFVDAVQCKIDNCWLQGGYRTLTITGTNSADNIFTRNTLTFATGPSLLWIARAPGGLNGGHHFYRCLFNQEYPLGTPTSANYKGAWAAATGYVVGDIVTAGSYYLRCSTAGNSSSITPTGAFYGTDITDGTVRWRLMGHTAYRAAHVDTGVSYTTFRECDMTGPFGSAIDIANTLAGDIPHAITVENCTAHGPITNGLNVSAGREIDIKGFNTFGPTGGGTTSGISLGGTDGAQVTGSQAYGFTNGVNIVMPRTIVSNNLIVGNTNGIHVAAAISHFDISHNQLGTLLNRGANVTGVLIDAGASDYWVISGNNFDGATTAINNAGATGLNGRIKDNPGHNPVGAAAIGVGASPFTYTAGHYNETVYINGGTVSIVNHSGGNVFTQSNVTIQLGPKESVTVTYTVAPTMTLVRH